MVAASAQRSRQQCSQIINRVSFGCVLVLPVALDARETKREPARVAGGGLDAVQSYLDHQLGIHEHGDPAPAGLALEQSLGLPPQELVRQALEGLADHHELAGARIAGAEMEVREPALPPPMSPFCAEHHEVVRAHRL